MRAHSRNGVWAGPAPASGWVADRPCENQGEGEGVRFSGTLGARLEKGLQAEGPVGMGAQALAVRPSSACGPEPGGGRLRPAGPGLRAGGVHRGFSAARKPAGVSGHRSQ